MRVFVFLYIVDKSDVSSDNLELIGGDNKIDIKITGGDYTFVALYNEGM